MKKVLDLKDNKIIRILAIILIFLGGIAVEQQYQSYMLKDFSIDRLLLIFMVCSYFAFNVYFGIKKTNEFCFRRRYWIGLAFFIYIVANGYHGSSMYAYNYVIEPNYPVTSASPFISDFRDIRSDEYVVNTPSLLNQALRKPKYSSVNNAIMADNKSVLMFPQLPTYNISVLSNPRLFGFFVLDTERAYSFYWYIGYFIGFFGLLELLLIITKGKKLLSVAGTFMILFSPGVLWWTNPAFISYGSWAIVIFNAFFKQKKKSKKFFMAALLGWVGSMYIMLSYPAWQITYGYMYLGFVIYILYLNRKKLKLTDLSYLLVTFGVIGIIIVPAFIGSKTTIERMTATLYPGKRSSIGGTHWQYLFNYIIAIFYSRYQLLNPSELSQYISFYPIPLLIGIYQIVKNIKQHKNDVFLNCMVVIAILLSLWNFVELPHFSKFTLLSMSIPERSQMTVGLICSILVIYILANYERKKLTDLNLAVSFIISGITALMSIMIINKYVPGYFSENLSAFTALFYFSLFMMILLNYKKTNIIFSIILITMASYFIVTIIPVSKGLDVMFEKQFAKEIQSIVDTDGDAKWLVVDPSLQIQGYVLANGARVINSTNYYPNFDLWKKFDPEGENDYYYNRYAHVVVNLTDEDTYFELLQQDLMRINVNTDEFCEFDAKYVVSMSDIDEYNTESVEFEKLYKKDNLGIYMTHCLD